MDGSILASVWALLTVIVLVIGLYAIIVLVARILHRFMPATSPPRDPAIDALRTRFATGHIDEAEYERLRSVLQRH